MDLPDCPPGAEGYQDSVTEKPEKPKKPTIDECTKAEQEFQEHLNSLKIKLEDGTTRSMVERRGRDVSGKWIYLCYPCAAMCSGESILQTHISGKKHKTKLAMKNVWPISIFEEHPYVINEKGGKKGEATEKVLQKMAAEVEMHNQANIPGELNAKYNKYRTVRCHLQDIIDGVKAPLLGLEYLVEHPPEEPHHEPSYVCLLCNKHGHPRTIINHMTCFWHRYNFLARHYHKAVALLAPYRTQSKYREGVSVVINRLAQRIEDKFGRLRPVNIDKEEYDRDKDQISQWIFKSYHFSEQNGPSFEEVVDTDLITSLLKTNDAQSKTGRNPRDPSPPKVAAPAKPQFNTFSRSSGRQERRAGSVGSLSDISDEHPVIRPQDRDRNRERDRYKDRPEPPKSRYEPYPDRRRADSPPRNRYGQKITTTDKEKEKKPNYEYKLKLAEDKRRSAEESAKKTLAYHEKNPEKHPLYPEEWKKFWNRRYKEIQAEGKDPSKHDYKPEWIVFWTARMKELHEEELRGNILEIYRKLCLSPPDLRRMSPEPKKRSPEPRRRSVEKMRSRERRPSPRERRRSPDFRRDRRTPDKRHSPRRSPPPRHGVRPRTRSPMSRGRSPARATHIMLESVRRSRSRSPLSRRIESARNRSPQHHGPSSQTVMISDDELKPEALSPWNSDNDLDSLGSLPDAKSPPRPRSRTSSLMSSRTSRSRTMGKEFLGHSAQPQDLGPPENVVATLRLLVALEDYLGSLGPKIVDLLTEALKLEKEKANSSEELLERESAVVLIETAKEKLKGAVQAGLVPHTAAPAVRTAVVRAAATLHEADTRLKRKQQNASTTKTATAVASMPVAGVGEVDRAQIAQQMAAALIAQGKTDVSSEELAQLVDAVVGMAEAKKREAEVKKKVEARAANDKASRPIPPPAKANTAASALQMLQSAYDENDKHPAKLEKDDVPDAMDGLSDSDLETLLKNFNELSAEEQHSLIAYLKKLEAREPQRVERLRQYVSAAATATAPRADEPAKKVAKTDDNLKPVAIESDDDDYTVEEVFKSVTQKVKEDQMRQEMEIVKKSLEELKSAPPVSEPESVKSVNIDLSKHMSSATDLLALVQASIQSTSANNLVSVNLTPDVVTSNVQPRSFGDAPDMSFNDNPKPLHPMQSQNFAPQQNMGHQQNFMGQQGPFGNQGFRSQNQNFGDNRNFQNESYNNAPSPWAQDGPMGGQGNPRGPGYDNFQGQYNQGPRGNMNGRMQDNFDTRQHNMNQFGGNQFGGNQPFGNNNQQFGKGPEPGNFRGRGGGGRGNFRGRGRGYY